MFTIITNYKKLFLLTLRSEFGAGDAESAYNSLPKQNKKNIRETDIDNELEKMKRKGFIDMRDYDKLKERYMQEKLEARANHKINKLLKDIEKKIYNDAKAFYKGKSSDEIIKIKNKLNIGLKPDAKKLDLNEKIDNEFISYVIGFQRKQNIKVDGKFGGETEKRYNEIQQTEKKSTDEKVLDTAPAVETVTSGITIDTINNGLTAIGYKGISETDFKKLNEGQIKEINTKLNQINIAKSTNMDSSNLEAELTKIIKLEKEDLLVEFVGEEKDKIIKESYDEKESVETSKDTIAELEKQYSEKIDKLDKLVNDGKDYRYIQQQGSEKVFRIPERYFNGAKNPETVMYIASKVIGKEGTSSVERLISEANLGDIIGKKQGLELIVELNKVLSNNNKNIISINQMILSSEGLSKFKKVLSRTISLNYWNTPGNSRTDKEEFKSEIKDKKTEDERNAEKIHENYNIDTVSKSFIKELENLGLHKKMDENEKGEFLTNINEKPELRKILLSININSEKFNDLNDSRKVIQDIENNKDKSSVEKKLLKNSFKRDEDDYIKSFTNNKNLINKVKEYFENNKKGAFIVKDGNYIFDDKALDEAVKGNGVISGKIKVGKEDKEIVQSVTEASLEKINEMFKNLKFDESKIKALEGQRVPLSGNSNQGEQLYVKNGKIYIIGEYKKVGLIKSALITTGNNLDTQTAREIYIAAGASLLTAALIKGVKWKNLDPGKIKWSKIDPGKIKWSKIDPSKLIKDIDIDLSMSNVAKVGLGTYLGTSATLNYEIANLEAELDLSKGKEEASKILGTDIEDFKLNNKVQTTLNSIAERNYEIMDFDGKEYGVTFNKPLEVKYNNGKVIIYSIKVNQKGEILSGEFAFDKGVLSMESDKINIEKNNNLGINFNQLFIGMENGKKVVPDKLNFQNLNGKIEK